MKQTRLPSWISHHIRPFCWMEDDEKWRLFQRFNRWRKCYCTSLECRFGHYYWYHRFLLHVILCCSLFAEQDPSKLTLAVFSGGWMIVCQVAHALAFLKARGHSTNSLMVHANLHFTSLSLKQSGRNDLLFSWTVSTDIRMERAAVHEVKWIPQNQRSSLKRCHPNFQNGSKVIRIMGWNNKILWCFAWLV